MNVYVNGKTIELKSGKTIAGLMRDLNLKFEGIAIALNSEVVQKNKFEKIFLDEGDKIEIIQAVQGG